LCLYPTYERKHLAFVSAWLTSLNMMASKFIHLSSNHMGSFLSYCLIIPYCICMSHFLFLHFKNLLEMSEKSIVTKGRIH
jgi:hypothetical protein